MKERQIEELLPRVVLPPAPDSLRERVLQQTQRAKSRRELLLRFTWYRAIEAAATLAILAGAAGRAY